MKERTAGRRRRRKLPQVEAENSLLADVSSILGDCATQIDFVPSSCEAMERMEAFEMRSNP